MVPVAVAPVAWNLGYKAVRAIHQLVGLESDVELVHGTDVFFHTATVREQCTASVGIGLKPEHQCVVVLAAAVQCVLIQQHTLILLLQMQRQSAWYCPRSTYQLSVGTLCMVGHHVARALVHRVVVYQILLVARQSAVAVGSTYLSAVHGAVPQAGLHHAALVVLALAAILLVGTTEDERTRAGVHRGELVATNIQTAIVEGQHAIGLIQYHSHLVEAVLADGSVALEGLVVDHSLQLEVAGKPQLQLLSVGAV